MKKRSKTNRTKVLFLILVAFCLLLASCQRNSHTSPTNEVLTPEKTAPRPEDILQDHFGDNHEWYVLDAVYGESQLSMVVIYGTESQENQANFLVCTDAGTGEISMGGENPLFCYQYLPGSLSIKENTFYASFLENATSDTVYEFEVLYTQSSTKDVKFTSNTTKYTLSEYYTKTQNAM